MGSDQSSLACRSTEAWVEAMAPPADLPPLPHDDPFGHGYSDEEMAEYALAARALYETKVATLEQQRNLLMGKAGWMAQLVIDKLGGTPDLDEWIRRSAKYYQETIERAEAAEARVKELERQLEIAQHDSVSQSQLYSEYIEERTKERDALRTRVAELEERLMVMCVAQIKKLGADPVSEPVDSGLDERQYRLIADVEIEFSVPDGYERETLKAGTCVWLARWTDDQLEAARRNAQELHRKLKQSRSSPDPPAPAPLAAQGVEGEPQHER